MKTIVSKGIQLSLLTFACFFTFSSTITAQETGWKEHTHRALYRFDNTCLTFENKYIFDSSTRFAPTYFRVPLQEIKFGIKGPDCRIDFFDIRQRDMDKHVTLSSWCLDTTKDDRHLFVLETIEVKLSLNKKTLKDWTPVTRFNKRFIQSMLKKNATSFSLFNDSLCINDRLTIELRNQTSKQIFTRFNIHRSEEPIAPYMARFAHDSSTRTNVNLFVQQQFARKAAVLAEIDDFYQYWPDDHWNVNNERCYESSKLALYYRKPNDTFADSSLEYQLTGGNVVDTSWHKTGHMILVTQLEPNKHYTLLVRYKDYPEHVQKNTFYVIPRWYQTPRFKLWLILTIAISLIVWIWIVYRQRLKKIKERHQKLHLEMKAVRAQLNPHFVFNALGSIQGLINKNEIGKANQYLSAFSSLLRDSLNNNDKEMIPLQSELKTIDTYLQLEQMRFDFQFTITTDSSINTTLTEVPVLLLQPLVENAVKHGVSILHERGVIVLTLTASGKDLLISIKDNGRGFQTQVPANGHGLKLTQERIRLLNKTLKKQSILLVTNSSENSGTDVHLTFKNWL